MIITINDLTKNTLADIISKGKVICLDLGDKTIGVSISDKNWQFAYDRETIRRQKMMPDINKLIQTIDQESISIIVCGYPLEMDGNEGTRCIKTKDFCHRLNKQLASLDKDLPLILWDERLSSKAVQRVLIDEYDLTRAKRKTVIDSYAASFILEGFLQYTNNLLQKKSK